MITYKCMYCKIKPVLEGCVPVEEDIRQKKFNCERLRLICPECGRAAEAVGEQSVVQQWNKNNYQDVMLRELPSGAIDRYGCKNCTSFCPPCYCGEPSCHYKNEFIGYMSYEEWYCAKFFDCSVVSARAYNAGWRKLNPDYNKDYYRNHKAEIQAKKKEKAENGQFRESAKSP